MNINRIPTPALIVEADIFYKNLETMKGIFADKKVSLRPHYKSNKSSFIAHEQMKYGAKGITCAKLGEAIDLADSGIKDILIANQIVEESKINQEKYGSSPADKTASRNRAKALPPQESV